MSDTRRGRWGLQLLVLAVGVALSLLAGFAVWNAGSAAERRAVDAAAERAALAIHAKMTIQSALLRGAAGLFDEGDRVEPAEFRFYVDRLVLEKTNPGTLGIGFAAVGRDPADLARSVREATGMDPPPVAHWPTGRRPMLSQILLIEPRHKRNTAALGFDMLSEPIRAEAMTRAARTGEPALSGRVRLVQEIEVTKQPGFLLYLPLHAATERTRLLGWVYSPLRAHDLFDTIFRSRDFEGLRVSVHDGEPRPETRLYGSDDPRRGSLASRRAVDIAGRTLTVTVEQPRRAAWPLPLREGLAVGAAGLLITLLLALLVRQQSRSAAAVERLVEARTAELREANARLIEEAARRGEAEEQIRQMHKVEAIGQLTGGIAHDFNNMLAVILGNLDLARRQTALEGALRYVGRAEIGATRAAELTQRLLAFARRQPLAPAAIDVNRLVREMGELLRRVIGDDVELETVLAGGLWPALADRSQLENAILNLAVNARDAMDGGGKLTIETANCRLDDRYARDNPGASAGQFVMIAVSDTGAGMSEEVIAKAFDPFFTTKDIGKGSGLGLSQVFGFVKQSGGHVKIYSEIGEGTTVKLYLPRHRGAAEEPARAASDGELPRARDGERILVVEDEDDVRALSVEALRSLGYQVAEAANGQQALDLLNRDRDAFALVFTDVVMPGLNGRKLAERLREVLPGVPVLFTTGYTPNAIVHNGKLDSDVALLTKPFTVDALARKVRAVIDQGRSES